jgi:uncharacterized protein (DUF305 family)
MNARFSRSSAGAGLFVAGLLLAVSVAAQIAPPAAKFMNAMGAGMKKMDRDMTTAPMNGDVDHDFAVMMLPHHRGAIDMAKAELSYGKDPVMRRLAQEILVDQESEIDAMLNWLEKGGKTSAHNEK